MEGANFSINPEDKDRVHDIGKAQVMAEKGLQARSPDYIVLSRDPKGATERIETKAGQLYDWEKLAESLDDQTLKNEVLNLSKLLGIAEGDHAHIYSLTGSSAAQRDPGFNNKVTDAAQKLRASQDQYRIFLKVLNERLEAAA